MAGAATESYLKRRDEGWNAMVAAAQAAWQSPLEVIAGAVRRAVGEEMVRHERIMAGLSNEVYAATTTDGQVVIVRISHRTRPHFEQERWAIERCREVGVPVPDLLLIEHDVLVPASAPAISGAAAFGAMLSTPSGAAPSTMPETAAEERVSLCVERCLPGEPLGRIVMARGANDPCSVALLREAGAVLARLHTIPTTGYGYLDGTGRGRWPTWDAFLLEFLDDPVRRDRLERVKHAMAGVDTRGVAGTAGTAGSVGTTGGGDAGSAVVTAIEVAVETLLAGRGVLRVQPAQLVHHDYEPWHLFADAADTRSGAQSRAAHITGVIDLESCRGGDPAYDLAQWHVIHDAYAPVAPVIEGYRAAGGWSSGFGERLHLSLVHFRLLELLDRLKGRGQPLADDVDTAKRAQRLLAETVQKVVN